MKIRADRQPQLHSAPLDARSGAEQVRLGALRHGQDALLENVQGVAEDAADEHRESAAQSSARQDFQVAASGEPRVMLL